MTFFIHKFDAIATQYADNTAIDDRGQCVSYRALQTKAKAVAQYLNDRHLGSEDIVGLAFEKSADYIAALLGTWYAGAAFAPLPPSLPAARRDFIIQDAGIKHIINPSDLAGLPTADNFVLLDVSRQTLAYVMHTSGSTGTPKGVAVEQAGILNVLEAQVESFGMNATSRSLFYLSISFDASLSDIGTILLAGGTLVIADDATLRDGAALTKLLHGKSITHADMPPALLRILKPADMPETLGTIIIGGEACPPDTVRTWAKTRRIINVYGPTEATICTSLCLCDAQNWQAPLLGQAFKNVNYKIVDDELLIGGIQLARGYLNLPALNAQKFVTLEGERFYRTGDRVRALPDGEIEFLGRIDRQFKLRGQLVEPDEIETCLHRHSSVRQAAVVKTADGFALVAYIIAQAPISTDDLTAYIRQSLPLWMIPTHIIPLESFPQTATGKTDYTALANRPLPRSKTAHMPKTPREKSLWALWQRVLGHSNFGITESFYAAGGDSLGVIRLLLEADRANIILSPADIAAGKTIRDICAEDKDSSTALPVDTLKSDVALDDSWQRLIQQAVKRAPETPEDILLTGATGFLGSRVLSALLAQTDATIYCLVRAANPVEGLRRIQQSMTSFGLSAALDTNRLHIIPSDLALPEFGIEMDVYGKLSNSIGHIYHCAAGVNMVADYKTLRPVNVEATKHILRFALTGARKNLHHASTLSVFVSTDQNTGIARESDRLEGVKTVYGGYAQTKFASEYMLLQIPPEAVAIHHYRFGLLTGDTTTGRACARDFLTIFVSGIRSLGYLPEGFGQKIHVDITPIDYAARAMTHLAKTAPTGIYHIANRTPARLADLMDAMLRAGHNVKTLPLARWHALTQNRPLDITEAAAVMALCRSQSDAAYQHNRTMDLFQATDIAFDTQEADKYLHTAGIICPPVSSALLDLYLAGMAAPANIQHICVFGPESTGKSTLAEKLAAHFDTPLVPEYAKTLIEQQRGKISAADMPRIAAGQQLARQQSQTIAKNIVVNDTDVLTTTIWSRWFYQDCPTWIDDLAATEKPALTFLMDIDTPWVDDIHRYLPDDRENFLKACKETLKLAGRPYILLSGTWQQKFDTACRAIEELQQEHPVERTGT